MKRKKGTRYEGLLLSSLVFHGTSAVKTIVSHIIAAFEVILRPYYAASKVSTCISIIFHKAMFDVIEYVLVIRLALECFTIAVK